MPRRPASAATSIPYPTPRSTVLKTSRSRLCDCFVASWGRRRPALRTPVRVPRGVGLQHSLVPGERGGDAELLRAPVDIGGGEAGLGPDQPPQPNARPEDEFCVAWLLRPVREPNAERRDGCGRQIRRLERPSASCERLTRSSAKAPRGALPGRSGGRRRRDGRAARWPGGARRCLLEQGTARTVRA